MRDGREDTGIQGAYRQRRCLVPVDGFYEWKKIGKVKQPFLIAMKSGAPFTLAGLWENWKEPATGEWIRTFTIVTTDANALVAELHDRMPVIIGPSIGSAGWIRKTCPTICFDRIRQRR